MTGHIRFTVAQTSSGEWAIFHQAPPKKTERGESLTMRFPALIASEWLSEPEAALQKIADTLNAHESDQPTTDHPPACPAMGTRDLS